MEIIQPEGPVRPGPGQSERVAELKFRLQLESRLNELKADIAKRPFFFFAIAFISGFASNTYPARILFRVIMRLVSWLIGPAILVMGVIKLSDLFCSSQKSELTIVQRP